MPNEAYIVTCLAFENSHLVIFDLMFPAVRGLSSGEIFGEFERFSFSSEKKSEQVLLKILHFREVKARNSNVEVIKYARCK